MAQQALNNLARGAIGIGAAASLAQASLFNVDGGFRAVMFNRLQGVQVSTTAHAQAQHSLHAWPGACRSDAFSAPPSAAGHLPMARSRSSASCVSPVGPRRKA